MIGNRAGEKGREPRPRILVIEDDPGISDVVAHQLTRAGYRVATRSGGVSGLNSLHGDIPDLLILDRMLPELSGDEVLASIRRDPATRGLPVIVVTAKGEEVERIEGLEMGADDYVTKPFSPRELVLRVDAILRRARTEGVASTSSGRFLKVGPLGLNLDAKQVTLHGSTVAVTPTEYRLLRSLLERRGQVRTRDQLLADVRDIEPEVAARIRTRSVDMHIRRLRSKLGSAGDWIETVRGFGYRFREPRTT